MVETIVQSVERALDVLTYVVTREEPPSLTDVSQALGLSKSTVHRLLSSLQTRAALEKDSANRYRVGPLVFQWGSSLLLRGVVVSLVLPLLQQLRNDTGETASFHILSARHHVCVEQAVSNHELRRAVEQGKPVPLGAGATSKVILAYLPPGERLDAISSAYTHGFTQLDAEAFESELLSIKIRGVAFSFGERFVGTSAAAAAVFNRSGRVIGALALSGPADRLTKELLEGHAQRLKEAAARISWEMGYRPSEQEIL